MLHKCMKYGHAVDTDFCGHLLIHANACYYLSILIVPHVPSPTEPSTSTTEPSTASLTTEDATDDHETLNMGSVDDGGSNVSLIGGVSGVVAGILVLVLVIVCIIILWLHLKRNRKSVPITSTGLREISNAVYGEG